MKNFSLRKILSATEKKPSNKEVFCITEHLKAQFLYLEAGNSIPPCKMDNDVLFYFLSGEGTITVDDVIETSWKKVPSLSLEAVVNFDDRDYIFIFDRNKK